MRIGVVIILEIVDIAHNKTHLRLCSESFLPIALKNAVKPCAVALLDIGYYKYHREEQSKRRHCREPLVFFGGNCLCSLRS